jgi:DNA-binding LacI/PurR family transcriptional regulator
VEGIEHQADANGYDTLVCITRRDIETERRYSDMVRVGLVKGLVFFTSTIDDQELESVAREYPVVQCGAYVLSSKHISYVCIDNVSASFEAVSHLIALGNRRIAFINGPFKRPYENDRLDGYLKALERNGIHPAGEYIEASDYTHFDAYEACRRLMSLENPPTALFCCSDQMAAGAMKLMMEKGLRIGGDIDVIGFDGTFMSEMYTPSISCVEQPGYDMGRTAFNLLRERVEDKKAIVKKVVLPHRLVLRQSTKSKP